MEKLTKDERKALRKEEWQEQMKKEQQNGLLKKISWWVGAIVVLVVAFWAIINFTGSSDQPKKLATLTSLTANDITTGPRNAKITLVEYADFQCPACGLYHPLLKKLLSDFNGRIYFVYRFFPLTSVHKNALVAAEAAYAANKQGKFWEMHDMLYETQKDWAESNNASDTFLAYAKKLNLNIDQFKKDAAADTTQSFIMSQENEGIKIGVNSTPSFFINGKQIENPQGYEAFKALLQQQLNGK